MSSPLTRNSDLGDRFPGLATLASQYVSNSWDYQFGTPEAAVEAFVEDYPDLLSSAADGIDELLRLAAEGRDLMPTLRPLGWGFAPDPPELVQFLLWTSERLR